MEKQKINHLAVWICAALQFAVSGIWYSPLMFGDKWLELMKKPAEYFQPASPIPFALAIASAILACYAIAWLFRGLRVVCAFKGLQLAVIIWFVFLLLPHLTISGFSMTGYSLAVLTSGDVLIAYVVTGLILGGWRKTIPSEDKE